MPPLPVPTAQDGPHAPDGSEEYETRHVHQVYEHIASHFSATRFKPWPIVERFLNDRPTGSVGLDIGCGNGKYLTVNPNIYMVGSDRRSSNLVRIAHDRKIQDSFVADALDLPHPNTRFDFAISIAVIHHFSSPERRVEAVRRILATLKRPNAAGENGGQALIYVWALEQKSSRRGWSEGDPQDVFVPWVMGKQYMASPASNEPTGTSSCQEDKEQQETPKEVTYQRYYHLYRKSELNDDVVKAGGVVIESGYERDNWWVICSPSGGNPAA
ncbi:S-adenosyl-L-methionine-dependent methyltransferase [Ascodesmis nigricans]|uniref:S-adenosyl-L-methionine-dependent methyltransferase n=1 Tax=Ascodesmis nigricans TaxID=341454 RepID=A0A4S2MLF8_9PEZI|nr:S-adenosyl-L-methionine-dependent methyltransferase [Ascodesmis nigricans]